MPAISTADQNTLNMFPQSTRLGMAVFRATGIVSAEVSGSPSTGATSLTLTSINETRTPYKHYTVIAGSSAGTSDGGKTRMKTWSSPTLTVAANNIQWTTYPYITILEEILPWAIIPDLANDKEDGDVAYTDENLYYRPLAQIGPPAVGWTSQAIKFWSDSAAIASGASISSHAWVFPSGSPASSSSAGSAASPISVTWSAATGHIPHFIRYSVTDSNGKTHTRYSPVWVFDDFNDSYCDWELESLNGDYESGGLQARIRVFGDATTSEFPEDAMVVIFAEDRYGGHKTSIGGNWDHRENILFVGWIARDSVFRDDEKGDVSFELVGPALKMKELNCWPCNLEYVGGTPNSWHKLKRMTCDLAAYHILTEHTTMDHICDVVLSGNTKVLRYVDIPEANPYQQIDDYCAKPIGARLLSDRQGRLYLSRNPNLRPTSERTSVATVVSLDIDDPIRADPGLELAVEEHEKQVAQVDFVAFGYDGKDVAPVYSLAPEHQYETGRVEKVDGIRADNQSEANELAGLYLANLNNIWREVRLPMFNWRVFDIVPEEYTKLTLAAGDTRRGVTWSAQKLICRAVSIEFDTEKGQLYVTPSFEKDSSGPSGVTGDYPTEPPEPDDPPAPSWPIDVPGSTVSIDGPLAKSSQASDGVHTKLGPGGWHDKNSGETGTQLQPEYLITDAWWWTPDKNNTRDPAHCIYWKCGEGYIRRSTDGGGGWEDVTPPQDSAADTALAKWADDPAPAVTDLTYVRLHDSIHYNGTFYAIATWQNGSSEWRSWLLKTENDGLNWDWKALLSVDVDDDGWIYPSLMKAWYGWQNPATPPRPLFKVESGQGTAVGQADGSFLEMKYYQSETFTVKSNYRIEVLFDFGAEIIGEKIVQVRGYKTGTLTNYFSSGRYTGDSDLWDTAYATGAMAGWSTVGGTIAWLGSECPSAADWYQVGTADSDENFRYFSLENVPRYGVWVNGSQWFCDTVRVQGTVAQPQVRALGIEVDSEDSSRVYVTVWSGSSGLQLWVYDSDLNRQRTYDLGAATAQQVEDKDYICYPFSPHQPSVANWGNHVFVYGRMAGSISHLGKSEDAGVAFADAGNAAWAADARVCAFDGLEHDSPSETRAFLTNNPNDELWRAIGAAWCLVATLAGETKHISRAPQSVAGHAYCAIIGTEVYYSEAPYDTWQKLTNQPPPISQSGVVVWIL